MSDRLFWICSCGNKTWNHHTVCAKCSKPRPVEADDKIPPAEQERIVKYETWQTLL